MVENTSKCALNSLKACFGYFALFGQIFSYRLSQQTLFPPIFHRYRRHTSNNVQELVGINYFFSTHSLPLNSKKDI